MAAEDSVVSRGLAGQDPSAASQAEPSGGRFESDGPPSIDLRSRAAALSTWHANHLDSEEIADVERAVANVWRPEVERLSCRVKDLQARLIRILYAVPSNGYSATFRWHAGKLEHLVETQWHPLPEPSPGA